MKYVTKTAIAQRYSVSPRTVTNWVRQGIVGAVRIGRVLRFDVEACDAALSRKSTLRTRTKNLGLMQPLTGTRESVQRQAN